ncbi:hypothetical protein HK097_006630, partial [Rhizophlyctis rosea]
IISYLPPRDLSSLLQLPHPRLNVLTQYIIHHHHHTITSLSSLHAFLAYGGRVPVFYRTATMLLFGKHFALLVPEARHMLGIGYAFVLASFM